MKRVVYMVAMITFVLFGCSERENPPVVQPDKVDSDQSVDRPAEQTNFHASMAADPSNFHFIADWLNDTRILYVEKNGGFYQVNYFDIETGESKKVYEDEAIIIDVLVHPSRDYLLVHTSEHTNSAVVKMVGLDGIVQHEVEIDSTELAIEWNRSNPEKILFTAFHEDWTFDLFVFDGMKEDLSIIELDDPFPEMGGEDRIMGTVYEDHPLDGGNLMLFKLDTGELETIDIGNVIYFDVFADQLVAVQTMDEDTFSYTVRRADGSIVSEWTLPAVSNYSEWVVPTLEWLDDARLIVAGAEKSGQLDEMNAGFTLYLYNEGNPELLVEGLEPGPLKCSPSGRYCLSGYTSEELIDVDAKEKHKWIEFTN